MKVNVSLFVFSLLLIALAIPSVYTQQETMQTEVTQSPIPRSPETKIVATDVTEKSLVDIAPDELPTNLVKVLRTTNKAQVNQYVAKVYDFVNVNPNEVANFIANGLEVEEGGIYTFVHPDGNKGKMLVICPKYQIPWLDKVCQDLDRPKLTSAPGSAYKYYRLKHRSAADASFLTVVQRYTGFATNREVGAPTDPYFPVISDIETNSLLLFDVPSGAEYAENALKKYLDSPTPQVNIDVKIYEIDVRNDGTLGLDYEAWKNGPGQALFATQFTGKYARSTYNHISYLGLQPPFTNTLPPVLGGNIPDHFRYNDWYRGYGYRVEYPSAFFDFLVEKGKAKALIDTKLSTCNANPALISTGESIFAAATQNLSADYLPYFNVTNAQTTTGGRASFNRTVTTTAGKMETAALPELDIKLVENGVYLTLTPIVGQEETNIDLSAKVINHIGWASNGEPLLSSFQIKNKFRVKNGDQIMIGGLTRERLLKSTKKIPLLGSLPVLGWIFGGETDQLQKSILVVALRPTVITDFSGITAEDQDIIDRATGVKPLKFPEAKVGFDQFLLDAEK